MGNPVNPVGKRTYLYTESWVFEARDDVEAREILLHERLDEVSTRVEKLQHIQDNKPPRKLILNERKSP